MKPSEMTPPWSLENSTAAIAEGWEIFDCEDSSNGRWQLDELDSPEDWKHLNNGVTPPSLLDHLEAWKIVANGVLPHHVAAREFLQAHNPGEYELIMKCKER